MAVYIASTPLSQCQEGLASPDLLTQRSFVAAVHADKVSGADAAWDAVAAQDACQQGQAPPWVQDVCNVLQQEGMRHTIAARTGPRGTYIYIVQWQRGQRPFEVPEVPSPVAQPSNAFGFLGDVDEPQACTDSPTVEGAFPDHGCCVLVDAPCISTNQPHMLSLWAQHMVAQVVQQHAGATVLLYTEWARLGGADAKLGVFTSAKAHTA